MVIPFVIGACFILISIGLLIKNNQSTEAYKLTLLVISGLIGLGIEVFVVHRFIGMNVFNLNVGFIGMEVIKSYILLAFGKYIQKMV